MTRLLKFSLIILSLPLIFLIVYLLYLLSPTGKSDEKIRFVIPVDTPQEKIAADIKDQGFIRSEKPFLLITFFMRFPGNIEPGAYLLSHNMTLISIADTLLNKPYQKWLTIVPGNRVEQIAEKLEKTFRWDKNKINEFLSLAKEGYMVPETYLINVDYTPKQVVEKFLATFNEKFDAKIQEDLHAQNVRNDTAIKIASLIERESGGSDDKKLIAGIIWNRLDKGMRLQIDATAQYVLGKPGNWWPKVKPEDLKVDSPYNTYKIDGLPPAPIANPGIESILAAVYPTETDCLYYLHDTNKQIHCSETYQEHREKISEYLR